MTSSQLEVQQQLDINHQHIQPEQVLVSKGSSRIQARTTSTTQELPAKILCKLRIHTQAKLLSNSHLRMTSYCQIRLMMMTFGISHQVKEIQINSNSNMDKIDYIDYSFRLTKLNSKIIQIGPQMDF